MEVICLEDDAFFALVEKVVERLKEKYNTKGNKWLSKEEAMKRLNITSHTTLQKFRDEGRIRFSQPEKKIIVYDAESIDEYLEKHAKETFWICKKN